MWPKWYRPPFKRRIADIVSAAARVSGYSVEQIKGTQRRKEIVHVRFVVCALARDDGHSFPQIGRAVGGRDHSTICNAVDKADIYRKAFPDFSELFARVRLESRRPAL